MSVSVPRVILCGSLKTYPLMQDIAATLQQHGIASILPTPNDPFSFTDAEEKRTYKAAVSRTYFNMILQDDSIQALLVVNPDLKGQDSYIGANTFAELAVGFARGLPIYLYQSYDLRYKDELEAWVTAVLHGDLQLLIQDILTGTNYLKAK